MRRADKAINAELGRNAFFVASRALLLAKGFVAMDDAGTWAYGLHVYPDTGQALRAAGDTGLAEAWVVLTKDDA